MKWLAVLIALWFAPPVPVAAADAPGSTPGASDRDLDHLLDRLQQRYRNAASVHLEFVERLVNKATGRTLEERGTILVARPNRMRWEYRDQNGKLFVLKDGLAWFLVPDERVVYRMRPGQDGHRLPTSFLTGERNLRDSFAIEEVAADGSRRLKLTAHEPGLEYDYLLLDLVDATAAILRLQIVDPLGNKTTFEFSQERHNLPVPAGAFEFTVPDGVDLVDADDR